MTREQFTETLGWIFEDSPWVADRSWSHRPFASPQALHSAMVAELQNAALEDQRKLLLAHPDLGTRAKISDVSGKEQAGAGLGQLSTAEYADFTQWNRAYRRKFGIPFLYAVKGSTKSDIIAALRTRLASSPAQEFHEALQQVHRIAWFRIESLITG